MSNKLSRRELMNILNYDPLTGVFTWKEDRRTVKEGEIAGTVNKHGYVKIAINRKKYSAHILAILFIQGYWPVSVVDHKNKNKEDNRINNLRVTSHRINSRNAKISKNNKSGVKGVCWHKNIKKWYVSITTTKRVSLGYFSDFFEAVCKRKSAEVRNDYFTHIDY